MELTTEQLKASIAELEQQVAELSKDKTRMDLLETWLLEKTSPAKKKAMQMVMSDIPLRQSIDAELAEIERRVKAAFAAIGAAQKKEQNNG